MGLSRDEAVLDDHSSGAILPPPPPRYIIACIAVVTPRTRVGTMASPPPYTNGTTAVSATSPSSAKASRSGSAMSHFPQSHIAPQHFPQCHGAPQPFPQSHGAPQPFPQSHGTPQVCFECTAMCFKSWGVVLEFLYEPKFVLLRTALQDSPQGPPTANRQPPPTANCHHP